MQSKACAGCGKAFHPRAQSPKQSYCASPACQRERRRRWQLQRRHSDPAYRDNQSRAQQSWAERHPQYWGQYRQAHPQYTEHNRLRQRERDARQRQRLLAKMDVKTRESGVPSGTYRLSPIGREDLAKMDAWTVEITMISKEHVLSG
jgi:hypothetical protein